MAPRLAPFTAPARSWFMAEIAYLAERNPAAAATVIAPFQEARRTLAKHPDIARPGPIMGLRHVIVGPYVLTIRRKAGSVEILSIRHGRQAEPKE
ncbi:type II toxin-antitoxin system RelE/ParE family toxin [Paramagnetospirillum caucaseum]